MDIGVLHSRDRTSTASGSFLIGLSHRWRCCTDAPTGARKLAPPLLVVLACVCTVVTPVQADVEFRPYAEGFIAGSGIAVANLDYYPVYASLTAGFFFKKGFGLELHLDGEILPGQDDGYELAYEHGGGVGLRFESPPRSGLSGYAVLGYTTFSLRQERDNPTVVGDELNADFGGPRISLGLVQRLKRLPYLSVSAEFRKYYVEDGLDIDSVVVGLRVSR